MPSSVIANFQYNKVSETLRIIFVSGSIYDYHKVPEKIYQQMKKAFSKGIFLNTKVKGNYSFEKIK